MTFTVEWGEAAWRSAGPNRTWNEYVEDSWDEYLTDTDERAVTSVVLDERGLPKDDKDG